MKVLGYTRVSTSEQADEGVSLGSQEAKIEGYCSLYDLELVGSYSDPGQSGKSLERPGLAAARRRLAEDLDVEGIVVAKLDRLTRFTSDLGTLIEAHFTERAGKYLFCVSEQVDTRTAAGRLLLNVLDSVAQWERETIVERTKEGLNYKRKRGERIGSTPYGWDLDEEGPRNDRGHPMNLRKNPAEQKILDNIRELGDEGVSPRAIARGLNALGILSKKGGDWKHSSVQRLLSRPRG